MASQKLKVSVIIPSWNTKELLRHCLRSLERKSKRVKEPFDFAQGKQEIIVVDNGSIDGSPQMVAKEFPEIRLIRNKNNLGFGAANNQGIKKAVGEYFLLLNSDTIVKDKAPLEMANFLDKHPQVGAVGCQLLNLNGTAQPSVGPFPNLLITAVMLFGEHLFGDLVRRSYSAEKEVDWVMGAALMVKPEAIKKAGLMDEGIFMYMDEVEWCYRIKKAGYRIMFFPEAKVIHLGGGSSKTGRKDPILNIYRGLVYFYKKHYSCWKLFLLRMMLKLKALIAIMVGYLTNNRYLKKTYVEAFKIA